MLRLVGLKDGVPCIVFRFRVEEQNIVDIAPAPRATMRTGTLPHDLVAKVPRPKNHIQHHLQVVARRRVAVQIQTARRLQHPMQLHQARRHHHQVRRYVVPPQRAHKPLHQLHQRGHRAGLAELVVGAFAPLPTVGEGFDLPLRGFARLLTEQQVVVAVAVEGWVEVDEVDALVGQVLAHHFQVVAVVEGVVGHGESIIPIMQQSLRNCHHSLKFSRCRQGKTQRLVNCIPLWSLV